MAVDPVDEKVYWAEMYDEAGSWRSDIRRSNLEGLEAESLVTGIDGRVSGVALNTYILGGHGVAPIGAEHLYWAERDAGVIRRADTDGSNVEILASDIGTPVGLGLDWRRFDRYPDIYRNLYFLEWETNTLRRFLVEDGRIAVKAEEELEVETVIVGEGEERLLFSMSTEEWDNNAIVWSDGSYINFYDVSGYSEPRQLAQIDHSVLASNPFYLQWYTVSDSKTISDAHGTPLVLGARALASLRLTGDRIYWIDKRMGSIRRSRLDGTEVEDLVKGLEDAEDLALDADGRKMYWSDRAAGEIRRADLDGGHVEVLVASLKEPGSIALDVADGKIYWTSREPLLPDPDRIQRSDMNGLGVETVLSGLRNVDQLAVDPVEGRMYYTDRDHTIQRVDLHGASRQHIVWVLADPLDIALDVGARKLYWTSGPYFRTNSNSGKGIIQRSDLDGSNAEDIVTGLLRPASLVLDAPVPPVPATERSHTAVSAMVESDSVGRFSVEFVRNGRWNTITDASGRFDLDISSREPGGVGGLYEARAHDEDGKQVGAWTVELEEGRRKILELAAGGVVTVLFSEPIGSPEADPCSNGLSVRHPKINRQLVEDCRALVHFRSTWDSSSYWRYEFLEWTTSRSIEYWTGIQVTDSRVRGFSPREIMPSFESLSLEMYFAAPFSARLAELTALEVLSLPGQGIYGRIPSELSKLTRLTHLDLHSNDLTGQIPPELGKLSRLTHLDLSANRLIGPIPAEFGQLRSLEHVDLSGNHFRCVPEELAQLGNWSKWADGLPLCESVNLDELPADFDGDGTVGLGDFFLFADAFGSTDERFDMDGNGKVHYGDFWLFITYFEGSRAKLLALAQDALDLPDGPGLQSNPNPFNASTVLSWFILSPGPVRLDVYNVMGQRIRTLVDQEQAFGKQQVTWDGRDKQGNEVSSGVYLVHLAHRGGTDTNRLLYLK